MKRKIGGLLAAVLVSASSPFGATACGEGVQEEVENPVRQATEQIEGARGAQQQVENVQQQQQQQLEEGQ